jgi:hypothetical protein
MEREIWFDKILWSYMPCHWKGWAVLMAWIVLTLVTFFLAQHIANAFGYKDADWVFIPVFLPGWLSMMIIAERHS